jgi:hypothetical protein
MSNVSRDGATPISYINCTYVDGDTCDDYFTAEEVGQVQVITADGTKQTADISSLTSELLEQGSAPNSIQQKGTGAKALSDSSIAFISGIAGCLGYRYKAIDTYNQKIYLTSNDITYVKKDNPNEILTYEQIILKDNEQKKEYQANVLFTSTGWSESEVTSLGLLEDMKTPEYTLGELFTVKTRSTDFDRIAKIEDITNNVVTYEWRASHSDSTKLVNPFENLTADIVTQTDVLPDRYSFSVPTESEIGIVDISKNAVAIGSGARAACKYGIQIGANVFGNGDGAIAMGVDSEAGYQAIALGELVRALNRNVGMGYNIINEAIHSVSAGASLVTEPEGVYSANFGYQNRAKHRSVFMAGEKLGESKADHQVILGIRPNVYPEMLLVLGNGNSETMSNAFVVWKDGRASISAWPQTESDVVNVRYLTYQLNNLPMRAAGSGSVEQKGASVNSGQYSLAAVQGVVNASQAAAIGSNAKVNTNASYSIVLGANSEAGVGHVATTVLGYGCKTGANKQTVLGQYNQPINDVNAVLTVGNGRQDNIRSNALIVWKDGRVEISGDPVNDMDVVPKHMYDELLARVEALEAKV